MPHSLSHSVVDISPWKVVSHTAGLLDLKPVSCASAALRRESFHSHKCSSRAQHVRRQGQQHEDAAADAALLALLLTHREATLLFAMAARRGATDSQIADALRQGLPHLSGPDYLQDTRAGQEPEEKKVKHKGKKKRKTGQA